MVTILDDYGNIWHTPIEKVEMINANSSKTSKYNMIDEGAFMDNNKKYYYVYRIVNHVNGKEYIGFHSTDDLDDGYMGSGVALKSAIEKHGIENFTKEIIQIFDNKEDAEHLERNLVNEEYVNREDTYNISLGGNVLILVGEKGDNVRQKMSESRKRFYHDKTKRSAQSEHMKQYYLTGDCSVHK